MTSPLAFSPRPGPAGEAAPAAVAALFCAPLVVVFVTWNPLLVGGAMATVVVAGLRAGGGRALRLAARWSAAIALFVVAVNAFASQRGQTVLLRGLEAPALGRIDVTLEALVEGFVLGGRISIAMLAGAAAAAVVDPDGLIRLTRVVARRSALTASLIVRMVPLAAADHARLREAAALRGPAAAPVGRAAMLHRVVAGSLDRATDVAATLELRGYALGAPRSSRRSGPAHHGSWRFVTAAAVIVAIALAARLAGVADFAAYPAIEVDASAWTVAAGLSMPLVAWLTFGARRGGQDS